MTPDQVVALCDRLHGVRWWLMGGWGVDALLGRQTREHHDLDVLVHVDDLATLESVLRAEGFARAYDWPESRTVDGRATAFVEQHPDGRELDVHAVHRDGTLATDDPWELPAGALDGRGTVGGREVPCLSREGQRATHDGYDLPPHHVADLAALG